MLFDAKNNNYKRILILDDDVICRKDFNKHWQQWLLKCPKDWKIMLLGATQHVKIPSSNKDYYFASNTDGSFAVGC